VRARGREVEKDVVKEEEEKRRTGRFIRVPTLLTLSVFEFFCWQLELQMQMDIEMEMGMKIEMEMGLLVLCLYPVALVTATVATVAFGRGVVVGVGNGA